MNRTAIGIDVGGSNTDGALIVDGEVVALAKVPTCHEQPEQSCADAFNTLVRNAPRRGSLSIRLSTTLATNAVVEGMLDPVLTLAIPGPGAELSDFDLGFPVQAVAGSIDHRGRETAALRTDILRELVNRGKHDYTAAAVAGKFSHRNPAHEILAAQVLREGFTTVSVGHVIAPTPNFPRRLATTYLNSAVASRQLRFSSVVEALADRRPDSDHGEVLVLKADGGTMSLEQSTVRPVDTVLSGPAASVMAALALADADSCGDGSRAIAILIDIGGTTTDISLLSAMDPVSERSGANIGTFKTSVRALFSRSVGLGGDSEVRIIPPHGIAIGPRRAGTPACFGGSDITPTDAAVALGLANTGSQRLALEALKRRADDPARLAAQIMAVFTNQMAEAIASTIAELERAPAYTVREALLPPRLDPSVVIGLGAPAPTFVPLIARSMQLDHQVLAGSACASAIGAAAARPTAQLYLTADTALGTLSIPQLGLVRRLARGDSYTQSDARAEAISSLLRSNPEFAPDDLCVTNEQAFRVVDGFRTCGSIFHTTVQARPAAERISPAGGISQ